MVRGILPETPYSDPETPEILRMLLMSTRSLTTTIWQRADGATLPGEKDLPPPPPPHGLTHGQEWSCRNGLCRLTIRERCVYQHMIVLARAHLRRILEMLTPVTTTESERIGL